MKSARETYVLVLRPEPGVDAVRALRMALKILLRRFGLRVVKIEPNSGDGDFGASWPEPAVRVHTWWWI